MTGLSISMDLSPKHKLAAIAQDTPMNVEKRLQIFMQEVSGRALVMMENACQGQQDVAMDLVQEAFIALHQSYPTKSIDEWYPLFYTILNNKLIDWRRKEARQTKRFGWLRLSFDREEEYTDLELADPNQLEPIDILSQECVHEQIQSALKSLPTRQQQAFVLRAWEGFDTAATAKIMNCSEGSVKTHYHRAIQSLKISLAHLDNINH